MRIGSLFAGIGGLELGLERAGVGRTVWQVECDPYCLRVLERHWPDAIRCPDVRIAGPHNLPFVDLLGGGFPCQPHSQAGNREGSNDERDLWPEFDRCIRVFRPRLVVAENVPGLLTSDGGRFFNRVLSDLAGAGYDAEWDVLSAAAVGAPHLRERVFIIAWLRDVADAFGLEDGRFHGGREDEGTESVAAGCGETVGHLRLPRLEGHAGHGDNRDQSGRLGAIAPRPTPAASVCLGWGDGVTLEGLDGTLRRVPGDVAEFGAQSPLFPVAPRVPDHVARLRVIGNAVVPACAEVIGRRVLEIAREQWPAA